MNKISINFKLEFSDRLKKNAMRTQATQTDRGNRHSAHVSNAQQLAQQYQQQQKVSLLCATKISTY